ncbi:class I SAM-dependent methyltransferase [Streptomyces sp. NPDC007863]|uniref:class I SAM-dependent methyltransferase n=1 Tax=Streptomyces sp. NPDC007863 TaxID=3154894 RepID=UPI0033E68C0F
MPRPRPYREATRLVAVEPEPNLRAHARTEARRTPVPVVIEPARAERLPFPDASSDAAVVCLPLCSIADPGTAVPELRRGLRPGGQLRFFEHVQAHSPAVRRVQRVLDATIWPRLMSDCRNGHGT